ncbi:hypothetical protein I4100191B2_22420 [Clostridiales bacterium]
MQHSKPAVDVLIVIIIIKNGRRACYTQKMLKKLTKKLQMGALPFDLFRPNGKGGLKPDIHWGSMD